MKKTNLLFTLALAAPFMLLGCNSNNTDYTSKSDSTTLQIKDSLVSENKNDSAQINEVNKNDSAASVKFLFEVKGKDKNEKPTSDVSVSLNNKVTFLSSVTGEVSLIEKNRYKEMGIPETALSACSAWWAGYGDYFYMVLAANKITVFKGWYDEGQKDSGYHWKKFKEVSSKVAPGDVLYCN